MRRHLFAAIALVALLTGCGQSDPAPAPAPEPPAPAAPESEAQPDAPAPKLDPTARARALHEEALVFDSHGDTLMRVVDEGYDLGERHDDGHLDFPRMKEGGLDAHVFAVWVDPGEFEGQLWERATKMIDAFHEQLKKHPDQAGLALTAGDARRLVAEGKRAAFLGVEGGYPLECKLERLKEMYDRGVRYLTLVWWNNTCYADGSGDEPKWDGLNETGEEVVREMERLGMIVDLSHASEATFFDVMKVATKPAIASHSNTAAVAVHHRNLTDDQLRALAKNGGVVGINYVAGFLDEGYGKLSHELWQRLKPRFKEFKKQYADDPEKGREVRKALWDEQSKGFPVVKLDAVIDHIDHAVKVAGIDHVGLGSDFDGYGTGPEELTDASQLQLLTERLLARGYSEEDVKKILGGNFMRVFGEVLGE